MSPTAHKPEDISINTDQGLTATLSPVDNSVVQANITTIGDEARVPALPTSGSVQTLPEQTPVKMLSRLREITSFTWSTTSTGVLWLGDIEELLRNNAEHKPLLDQYRHYRSDFKLYVRINSNQFYSGAIMISHWPRSPTYGLFFNQRAVLRPVTVSASTQQSAEISISYPFEFEWIPSYTLTPGLSNPAQQLYVAIEVLAPLVPSSDTLADNLTVQVFASFVNPVLQFNADTLSLPSAAVAQSRTEITRKLDNSTVKSTIVATPATDANKRGNGTAPAYKEIAPTLSSVPILGDIFGSFYDLLKIGTNTISGLLPAVGTLAPLAPLLLDKPEVAHDVRRYFGGPGQDQFASDTAALAVPVTWSKNNYGSMLHGFGIGLGHWTLAQYASIPGIAEVGTFDATTVDGTVPIYITPTPLGRLQSMFRYWKGSIKMHFQAFASAFTSVRLAVYMRPVGETSANYDDHIVKIIDIKGDTSSSFTVPMVNVLSWYGAAPPYEIYYRLITPVVGADAALDPSISFVWWISGGPDIQFALDIDPTVDTPSHPAWTMPAVAPLPTGPGIKASPIPALPNSKARRMARISAPPPGAVAQSAIQLSFASSPFPPIVEGCSYYVDNGYALTDVPVSATDLLKRFRPLPLTLAPTGYDIEAAYCGSSPTLPHSALLNCFAAVRGGYMMKARFADENETVASHVPVYSSVSNVLRPMKTNSLTENGAFHCVAFPWMANRPFVYRHSGTMDHMKLYGTPYGLADFAFRDDVEVGLPVLPLTGS